jgi:hypothetical protein
MLIPGIEGQGLTRPREPRLRPYRAVTAVGVAILAVISLYDVRPHEEPQAEVSLVVSSDAATADVPRARPANAPAPDA